MGLWTCGKKKSVTRQGVEGGGATHLLGLDPDLLAATFPQEGYSPHLFLFHYSLRSFVPALLEVLSIFLFCLLSFKV